MDDLAPTSAATATRPARFYVEPAMAGLDCRAIFDRAWQLVAHVSQPAATPAHYVVANLAGLPVTPDARRGRRDRVFHNANCRHRRAHRAMRRFGREGPACRYHGWTHTLEGQLRPRRNEGRMDFRRRRYPPAATAVKVWQDWCSPPRTSMNASRFDELVAGSTQRLGADRGLETVRQPPPRGLRHRLQLEGVRRQLPEGYHVPHVHPGLNKLLGTTAATAPSFRIGIRCSGACSKATLHCTATATRSITGCGRTPCSTSYPGVCRRTRLCRWARTVAGRCSTATTRRATTMLHGDADPPSATRCTRTRHLRGRAARLRVRKLRARAPRTCCAKPACTISTNRCARRIGMPVRP